MRLFRLIFRRFALCAISVAAGFLSAVVPASGQTSASATRHVETWRAERGNAARRGELVVRIGRLEPRVGRVLVALYDAQTPFLSFEHQLDRQRVAATGETVEAVFTDVPYGNYAVAVVYDRNGNDRLDLRLGVLPTEPLGFSGGATVGAFGPPRYRAAAFDLASPRMVVPVTVR